MHAWAIANAGKWGWTRADFMYSKLQCNARVTVSVIMYDNESTYSSTSLQNNEHRVIAADSHYEIYRYTILHITLSLISIQVSGTTKSALLLALFDLFLAISQCNGLWGISISGTAVSKISKSHKIKTQQQLISWLSAAPTANRGNYRRNQAHISMSYNQC